MDIPLMFAAADALEYEVVKKTRRYGFFHAEGFGADVRLTVTQTIMQGASHCDFRYSLKKNAKDTVPRREAATESQTWPMYES